MADMKITLNLDDMRYSRKPQEIGSIRNRLCRQKSIKTITPEDLIEAVQQGRSFTPGAMTGTTGNTWQSQQVFCIDIDNSKTVKDEAGKTKEVMIPNPLRPATALQILSRHGIVPYFIYYSFSHKDEWPKFRIVIVLTEPITNAAAANEIGERLIYTINRAVPNAADKGTADNARIFFGSKPGSASLIGGKAIPLEAIQSLPQPKAKLAKIPTTPKPKIRHSGTLGELEQDLEDAKASFNLAQYVSETTTSQPVKRGSALYFNPCPICGHNDCFQVTGNVYHCWSSADGSGGSIVDYLMHKEGIDVGAALDKFKYEILGYDPEEWKAAWKEEQPRLAFSPQEDAISEQGNTEVPPAEKTPQERHTGPGMIDEFLSEVKTRRYETIPIGITDIDKALGGGFMRQTLVLLGAAPGAGKTALAQWIFEGMAKSGTTCLYLNLEMSRAQMLARSLSRIAAKQGNRITPIKILQGYSWDWQQEAVVNEAAEEYRENIAQRLIYNPDGVTPNLDSIMSYAESEAKLAEEAGLPAPLLVLDYLQVVTGGQREDKVDLIQRTISRLKGYAIQHNTVVFAIMAQNREANRSGISSMESGRDTSNIEYGADILLGLDYTRCLPRGNEKGKTSNELTQEEKKYKSLRILKSRFSAAGTQVDFVFDGESMTFIQTANNMIEPPRKRI